MANNKKISEETAVSASKKSLAELTTAIENLDSDRILEIRTNPQKFQKIFDDLKKFCQNFLREFPAIKNDHVEIGYAKIGDRTLTVIRERNRQKKGQ